MKTTIENEYNQYLYHKNQWIQRIRFVVFMHLNETSRKLEGMLCVFLFLFSGVHLKLYQQQQFFSYFLCFKEIQLGYSNFQSQNKMEYHHQYTFCFFVEMVFSFLHIKIFFSSFWLQFFLPPLNLLALIDFVLLFIGQKQLVLKSHRFNNNC